MGEVFYPVRGFLMGEVSSNVRQYSAYLSYKPQFQCKILFQQYLLHILLRLDQGVSLFSLDKPYVL